MPLCVATRSLSHAARRVLAQSLLAVEVVERRLRAGAHRTAALAGCGAMAAGHRGRGGLVGEGPRRADLRRMLLTISVGFLHPAPPDGLTAHRARPLPLPARAEMLRAEGSAA